MQCMYKTTEQHTRNMHDCGHTIEVFIYYKENYHNSSIMQPLTSYQSKRLLSVSPCFI